MARKILRNIDLYGMHGFQKSNASSSFNYEKLFAELQELPVDRRVFEVGRRVVAFPYARKFRRGILFLAVEGPIGVKPIILDFESGEARTENLTDTEVITETTHVLVYPTTRRAVIEYNRRGAKALMLGAAVEHIARIQLPGFSNIEFSFSPVVSEEFNREIDSLDRIRAVEFTVTKPNAGWADHYTELSDLLERSNGEKADIGVRASRGESLSKRTGVVALIKQIARDRQPYLLNARVFGSPSPEAPEIVVPLQQHVVREKARVSATDSGQVNPQELASKMADLAEGHLPNP